MLDIAGDVAQRIDSLHGTMSAVCLDLSGGRPREGLKLPLNRSLSEPGPPTPSNQHHQPSFLSPPKRCKLETTSVSLPTSPCAESATLQRALVIKKVSTTRARTRRVNVPAESVASGGYSGRGRPVEEAGDVQAGPAHLPGAGL